MNRLPDHTARDRISTAAIGGALGRLYFEGTIGIGDGRAPFPEWTLAAVIIAVGLALVGWALLTRKPQAASQPIHSDVEN